MYIFLKYVVLEYVDKNKKEPTTKKWSCISKFRVVVSLQWPIREFGAMGPLLGVSNT